MPKIGFFFISHLPDAKTIIKWALFFLKDLENFSSDRLLAWDLDKERKKNVVEKGYKLEKYEKWTEKSKKKKNEGEKTQTIGNFLKKSLNKNQVKIEIVEKNRKRKKKNGEKS